MIGYILYQCFSNISFSVIIFQIAQKIPVFLKFCYYIDRSDGVVEIYNIGQHILILINTSGTVDNNAGLPFKLGQRH